MSDVIWELAFIGGAVGAMVSIVWSAWRTGIGPMPSSRRAREAMVTAVAREPNGSVAELGCGWGGVVLALARQYPQRQIVGYELSWLPYLVSCLRARIARVGNLVVHRADFRSAHLSATPVWVCYLFPGGMEHVADKISEQCHSQASGQDGRPKLVVSNTFALPSHDPSEVIRLDDLHRTPVYVYRWDCC